MFAGGDYPVAATGANRRKVSCPPEWVSTASKQILQGMQESAMEVVGDLLVFLVLVAVGLVGLGVLARTRWHTLRQPAPPTRR